MPLSAVKEEENTEHIKKALLCITSKSVFLDTLKGTMNNHLYVVIMYVAFVSK